MGARSSLPVSDLDDEQRARVLAQRVETVLAFNAAAHRIVQRIGDDDGDTAKKRWTATVWLSAALILVAFVLAILLLVSHNPAGSITAAAVGIGVLAIAGFLNPLQTIERDIVFRRWSDMIVAGFFLQAGDFEAKLADIRAAATSASGDFAVLAAAHGKVSTRSAEAIQSIVTTAKTAAEETPADPADAVTVTAPTAREDAVGTPIEPLTVAATGPTPLEFRETGLPAGLAIDARTGVVSGTPTVAGTDVVSVTVESTADGASASAGIVRFVWVVTAAASAPASP